MSKKFYEMKLQEFKCAWENDYLDALRDFPDGTYTVVESGSNSFDSVAEHIFYNPVGTYKKMVKNWNELCIKAKTIIDKGIQIEDLQELLQLDILFYDILSDYCVDQEYELFINYIPREVSDITLDFYEVYFEKNFLGLEIEKYKMF